MSVYLKQIDLVLKAIELLSTDEDAHTALALIAIIVEHSKTNHED